MKKYIFSTLAILCSIACIVTYNIIGSEILADGTLSEPFFLIPLTYLFAVIAIISAIIICTVSMVKQRKNIQ